MPGEYSNQVQRELEEAYRKEKDRLDQLHSEVGQLGRFSATGSTMGRSMTIAGISVLVLLFVVGSWIMLTDPTSAKIWPFLVLLLAGGGFLMYLRKSRA